MKIIGIYKITSPSNRVYIGQSRDINTRLKNYVKLRCKSQTKLYNSLKKYGYNNHKIEIIEHCSIEELNDLEIHYISLYNCCTTGLNISPGGYLKSKESVFKQQQTLKRKFASGELTSKVKGTKNPITSNLNSKKIGKLNPNSLKCKCIITGKTYDCLKDAWKESYSTKYHYKTFVQYVQKSPNKHTTLIRV